MKQTVDLCVELGYDWAAVQILNPLVGTEMYRQFADQGFMADNLTQGKAFTAGVFSSLNLRQREEKEKEQSRFTDPFLGDLDRVPDRQELEAIWFAMDTRINYLPILDMTHPVKLENKRKILADVCDRVTRRNPLGNYFLAVVEQKLGHGDEANNRMEMSRRYLRESAFWKARFEAFWLIRGRNDEI
jgi:hypothetical protein